VAKTNAPPTITQSPIPDITPIQRQTVEPSATVTEIFTSTVTISPAQFHLLTHGPLPNWQYLVTFENTEPVVGDYSLIVDQNKEYTCFTRTDHPSYLYCTGPMAGIDTIVEFTLYTLDPHQEVLSGDFYIPYQFAP
jgi:hypothetical protein